MAAVAPRITARQAAKARTRAEVIATARLLFNARGYHGVTIRCVAKALRRPTGCVMTHFPDKASLYAAAMGEPAPDVSGFLRRLAHMAIEPGAVAGVVVGARDLLRGLYGDLGAGDLADRAAARGEGAQA